MRGQDFLALRYRTILSYTGQILLLESLVTLLPLLFLAFFPAETSLAPGFLISALLLAAAGVILRKLFNLRTYNVLSVQEGGVIVLMSWIAALLSSALPFMTTLNLTFTQAVFESVSGWTTTGLSVIDVTTAPRIVLLWRSIIQLAGGAGLAIIMISSLAGPAGTGYASAEGRSEQLLPNVRESARLVLFIYTGYALVGVLALWVAGMDWFDAVNHAFAAISTGGFSTRTESIGYWNSIPVEAITIVLMIFGNMNFLTAYTLFSGNFKAFSRNGEVRILSLAIIFGSFLLLLFVTPQLYAGMGKNIRVAIFEATSAITTTGFSTVGYTPWSAVGFVVLLFCMLIGGGTGSTAGGIKQHRVYLLYKALVWEIRRFSLPRHTVSEHYIWQGENKDYITDTRIREAAVFVFLYLMVYAAGVLVLTAYGYDLKESLFEYASSLSTVGLSIGVTSPAAPAGVLWAEIVGMFLGRLEFFIVFIGVGKLTRDFWLATH